MSLLIKFFSAFCSERDSAGNWNHPGLIFHVSVNIQENFRQIQFGNLSVLIIFGI
jgi:hypothetical protein